jgi:adenylate cyclase
MVTVLFCDICKFTQTSAQMDAHDVVDLLNAYYQPLVSVIHEHDGAVDKTVGDGLMALFGVPESDDQQFAQAVRAAVKLQQAVAATSASRATGGLPVCQMRFGVHCGEVFHGFVGSKDWLEFTVIGDAVNRAKRFCDAADPGGLLISEPMFQRVYAEVEAEKRTIQTKEGDLTAYRVKALRK